MLKRLIPLIAACAATVAAAPAQASEWTPCADSPGFECSTLSVPLDRQQPSLGTVRLSASRVRASDNPTNSAVVGLAGGPGQAALPLRDSFARVMASAITTRDLLIFDQRGTGESDPLVCGSLRSAPTLLRAEQGCASELGAARAFYRTSDSVADIEALRVASGYDRLVLFGVSYGTKVAQAYAAAYPDRVEALVLDSTVPVDGPDPFRSSSLAASRRVLRSLCADGACRSATPNVVSDLNAVARKLRDRQITGRVITSGGKKGRAAITQTALFGLMLAGDLNPTLRAELPGSLRAARQNDWPPLLRISQRAGSSGVGSQSPADSDSSALFLATTCEESPFPWNRAGGLEQKWAEASRAASRLTTAQRGPFSARTALEAGTSPLCVGWPAASPAPVPTGPLPQVPTLVLSGQMDLRTPVEDARNIKASIPAARVVEIPFTGHSVLTSDRSACAASAVTAFFDGTAVPDCPTTTNPYSPTPRPPRSLGSVKPVGRYGGVIGRAVAALRGTVTDARRQVIGEVYAQDKIPSQVGGLRSGVVRARATSDVLSLTLKQYSYVPSVAVSGQFNTLTGGTMTIRGPGIRGSLRLSSKGAVSGKLNGRRVSVPSAEAASLRRQCLTMPPPRSQRLCFGAL